MMSLNDYFKKILMIPIFIAGVSSGIFAADPYDSFPFPEGVYFLNYTVNANADTFNDKDGNSADNDMDFNLFQNVFRFAYYDKSLFDNTFVANIAVPVGKIDLKGDDDSGLGDITIASGYWIIDDPETKTWMSLGLLTIAPTGGYDKNKTANMGSNVWQIRPFLDVAKKFGKFQLEGTLRYNMYTKNNDTDVQNGSETLIETFFGYDLPNSLIGLHLNTVLGQDKKSGGNTVDDSAVTRYQAGISYLYNFGKGRTASLEYFKDLESKNTLDTQIFLMRLSWKF